MRVSVWRLATAVTLLTVLGLSGPLQRADGPDRPLTPTAASVGGLTIEDAQVRALLAGIEASDAQGLVEEGVVLAAATPATSPPVVTPAGGAAVPEVALAAYERAAEASPTLRSGCRVRWQILAGIGKVESNHGRGGGAQGVTEEGTVWPSIRGLRLDGGPGLARIGDTDGGRLDGDVVFDRAVGPMQFLPTSWGTHGHDGNKDTVKDPNNLFDAAFGAADHLCARAPGDYTTRADVARALYHYNPSLFYVAAVTAWIDVYDRGGAVAPVAQPVSDAAVAAVDVPSSPAAGGTNSSSAPSSAPSTASPSDQASPPDQAPDQASPAPAAARPQPAPAQPEARAPHPQPPPSAPAPSATPATPAPDSTPPPLPSSPEPAEEPGDADPAPELADGEVPEPFAGAIADPEGLVEALDAASAASDRLAAARLVGAWWALTDWCLDAEHPGCDDLAGHTLLTLTGVDPRGRSVTYEADTSASLQQGAETARRALGLPDDEVAAPLDRDDRPHPKAAGS